MLTMDRLWSPWRAAYVETANDRPELDDDTSIFAHLAAQDNDRENLILWRGAEVFVIMNLHPYNNGHLLVLPYRVVADYDALTDAERIALAQTANRCMGWLRAALHPDGFNVGMNLGRAAGAGIPEHLHMHVVPRWNGDTNFMPTTGQTKVIPESLSDTYAKLEAVIASDAEA